MSVPEVIRSALAARRPRRSVGIRMPVERGQVWTVQVPEAPPDSERMILVLRVDSHQHREFAEIMLVHPHIELAASSDLVVSPERSSLPYRAVVQADTRVVIWKDQLGGLIGMIDDVALDALGDVAVGQPFDREGLASGLPLRGRFDPRWDFKAQEGAVVRSLAADCTSALLHEGLPLQLDPGCLALELLVTCDDLETVLYRLLDLVTSYEVVFDLDDVKALEAVGALKISNWTSTFGLLGHDLYKSFWPLVEQALSTIDLPGDIAVEKFVDGWANDRRSEAGVFRKRPGHHVVSASYVSVLDRKCSVEHANEHGYQLIDA